MFWFLVKRIWKGDSLLRAMLNHQLSNEYLEGNILDLGSGGSDRYSSFIPRSDESTYTLFDNKQGSDFVNFETDALPYQTDEFDEVLLLNVLEHLYSPHNLLGEIKRIKKGRLVGYVPFLMWYHADPHDYLRYTHEALKKLLEGHGYAEVSITPHVLGPYCTAYQMIFPTVPRVLRPLVFIPAYGLDALFRKLRGKNAERYVLGYYFVCS